MPPIMIERATDEEPGQIPFRPNWYYQFLAVFCMNPPPKKREQLKSLRFCIKLIMCLHYSTHRSQKKKLYMYCTHLISVAPWLGTIGAKKYSTSRSRTIQNQPVSKMAIDKNFLSFPGVFYRKNQIELGESPPKE